MKAGHGNSPIPLRLLPLARGLACSMRSIRMGIGHHRSLFLVSLALLLVATTHTQAQAAAAITQQGTDDGVVVVGSKSMTGRSMIGSRPPSCNGRCGWWCVGRSCEAVLVPIEPPQEQHKKQSRRHGSGGDDDGSRASAAAQQRRLSAFDDGDYSNYKPITWRCKCVG